jgi:GT2 family glycosyltransferase
MMNKLKRLLISLRLLIIHRKSGLFDPQWYLEANPDVKSAKKNPWLHFALHGVFEGRNPHPVFDSAFYLENNPDVAASNTVPYLHFIRHGLSENRSPNPFFDPGEYLALNPDVARAGISPVPHYVTYGFKEIQEGTRPHYSKWVEFVLPQNKCSYEINSQDQDIIYPFVKVICVGWDLPTFESLRLNSKIDALNVSDINYYLHSNEFFKKKIYIILSKYSILIQPLNSLFEKIQNIIQNPLNNDLQCIYWDEIHTSSYQQYERGHFKPDFSEHYLWSTNYLGSAALIRGDLLSKASDQDFTTGEEVIYHCALSLSKKPEAFLHIQEPLTKTVASDFESELHPKEKEVVRNFLQKKYQNIEILDAVLPRTFHINLNRLENPLISIIVPFRDRPELLEECLDSIFSKTTYQKFEVLAVNNGSSEASMHRLKSRYPTSKVKFINYDGDFNYSAINNFAVRNHAEGELVLLLNNDTAVIEPNWIQHMLQYALEPGVGAVGAKLLYENQAVQHAGIVIGPFFNVGILFAGKQDADPGYFGRANVTSNCIAVTAACLLVSKTKYIEVGGLDEDKLKIAYNDIDFCLKLHQRGYANVHAARAKLFHFESLSRGKDEVSLEKTERMHHELWNLKDECKSYFDAFDPFYNSNFSKISPYAWFEYNEKYVPSKSEHMPVDFTHQINYVSEFSAKNKSRLALFSHYDKHGIIDPYVVHYLREICKYSDVVFISTSPGLSFNKCKSILPFVSQIILKENSGYDFGAWKTGMVFCEEILKNYSKGLILLNDSIYGPFYSLEKYFQAADEYDVYSMTDSYDLKYHLQSYFVTFSKNALENDNFKNFWNTFHIIKNKISLIFNNEIGFYSKIISDSRLKVGSQIRSCELESHVNISHFYWKNLLDGGVPFLKVELLRDNPVNVDISDWEEYVGAYSKSLPELINNHIKRMKGGLKNSNTFSIMQLAYLMLCI